MPLSKKTKLVMKPSVSQIPIKVVPGTKPAPFVLPHSILSITGHGQFNYFTVDGDELRPEDGDKQNPPPQQTICPKTLGKGRRVKI
jgi:hypothetical protein